MSGVEARFGTLFEGDNMLRNRLILVTLLISLVPLVLLGAFSSQQSRSLLAKSAADTLDSQAGLKGSQIAAYLESVRHDVMALAESQMSRQAMPAFATGFQTFLDQELGEDVGDLVALGAVVDDEPVAELFGETDAGPAHGLTAARKSVFGAGGKGRTRAGIHHALISARLIAGKPLGDDQLALCLGNGAIRFDRDGARVDVIRHGATGEGVGCHCCIGHF
jgi:hypothetical protein